MKKDFSQPILNLDGTLVLDPSSKDEKPLSLQAVCINALLSNSGEENESGEQKYQRFVLAQRIHSNHVEEDYKPEEIALIKKLIAKIYLPLVVGQSYQLLDK